MLEIGITFVVDIIIMVIIIEIDGMQAGETRSVCFLNQMCTRDCTARISTVTWL